MLPYQVRFIFSYLYTKLEYSLFDNTFADSPIKSNSSDYRRDYPNFGTYRSRRGAVPFSQKATPGSENFSIDFYKAPTPQYRLYPAEPYTLASPFRISLMRKDMQSQNNYKTANLSPNTDGAYKILLPKQPTDITKLKLTSQLEDSMRISQTHTPTHSPPPNSPVPLDTMQQQILQPVLLAVKTNPLGTQQTQLISPLTLRPQDIWYQTN